MLAIVSREQSILKICIGTIDIFAIPRNLPRLDLAKQVKVKGNTRRRPNIYCKRRKASEAYITPVRQIFTQQPHPDLEPMWPRCCIHMCEFFDKRGYRASVVKAGHHRVQQIDRQSALQTSQKENNNRIPFTLTFHPHNQAVKSIILKNFKLLQNDPDTGRKTSKTHLSRSLDTLICRIILCNICKSAAPPYIKEAQKAAKL